MLARAPTPASGHGTGRGTGPGRRWPGVIGDLFPPGVATAELFGDPPEGELFPEEEPFVARSRERRRREFTSVRACARKALAELGLPPAPILRGHRGAPVWPPGVVGSMTHCAGYRAAVLGRATHLRGLGVDAEPHQELPPGVLDLISLPAEREWVAACRSAVPGVCWDRLLFCAKECVYKVWFPLTNRWLGFEDALVTVDPGSATFRAELLVEGPPIDGQPVTGFVGRWEVTRGVVVAGIALPREGPADAGAQPRS